ncbi:MAG: tetratricopeptide repeat protein [Pirellulales bacterium]|nr:tetratricopeptide repeat protein [Pirellulales bacterium]
MLRLVGRGALFVARPAILAVCVTSLFDAPRRARAEEPPTLAVGPLLLEDAPAPLAARLPLGEEERDKKEALILFAEGRAREQRNEFAPALRCYQRAWRLDPRSAEIAGEIIPLALRLNREGEAVRYALAAIELEKVPDPLLLRQLGEVQAQRGEWRSALRLFARAAAARPALEDADGTILRLELGRLYHLDEKYEKAADCFAPVVAALAHPEKYKLDEKTVEAILEEPVDLYQVFGDAFVRAGRLEEARAAFEKADSYSPDKAVLQYELARVHLRGGKPAEALAALEAAFAEKLSGKGMGPYELYAEVLDKLGRPGELIPRLEKLRAAESENLSLGYFLAAKYADANDLQRATALYSALLKQTPAYTGYRGLADVYARTKNDEGLLALLGEAQDKAGLLESLGAETAKISGDAELLRRLIETAKKRTAAAPQKLSRGESFALGMLAADAKRWADAEEFFNLSIQADPRQSGEVYLVWGLGLLLAERSDDAVKVFQRAIDRGQTAEESANYYFYLAGALALEKRTEEALAAATKAAELKSGSIAFLARPAWVLAYGHRREEAYGKYRDLLQKYENDFSSEELREGLRDVRLAFSNVCALLNRTAEAEEQLELALDEYPDDPVVLNDLGYLWADRNEHLGRACRMIRKAVAAEPDNAAFRDSLGWVLFRQKQYAEAAVELQKAAEKMTDGAILDHLGDVYLQLGQAEKAHESWRRAAESFRKEKEEEKAKVVEKKMN